MKYSIISLLLVSFSLVGCNSPTEPEASTDWRAIATHSNNCSIPNQLTLEAEADFAASTSVGETQADVIGRLLPELKEPTQIPDETTNPSSSGAIGYLGWETDNEAVTIQFVDGLVATAGLYQENCVFDLDLP